MPIGSLCSKKPAFIRKDATIREAARLMKVRNVGSLVVTESDGGRNPVGIVTDRDLALKVFTKGLTGESSVERVMSKKVVSARSDAGIAEVVDQMERHGVRRIVVQDKGRRLRGTLSSDDILQLVARARFFYPARILLNGERTRKKL